MTRTATLPETPDDALGALLPAPSRMRAALWALVFLAVCVFAWFAPSVLQSVIVAEHGSSRSGRLVEGTPFVLEEVGVRAQGWPSVTVESVSDLAGAHAAAAWLLSAAEAAEFWRASRVVLGTDEVPTMAGVDVQGLVAALVAAGAPLSGAETGTGTIGLPAELADGAASRLVVLWQVTDCNDGIYRSDPRDPDPAMGIGIRSWWGQRQTIAGEFFDGPFWDRESLSRYGICG